MTVTILGTEYPCDRAVKVNGTVSLYQNGVCILYATGVVDETLFILSGGDWESPALDDMTQTKLALAELAETEAAHDLENKLAIAELAETMLGGAING